MFKTGDLEVRIVLYVMGVVLLATLPLVGFGIILSDKFKPGEIALLGPLLAASWLAGLLVTRRVVTLVLHPIHLLNEAVDKFSQGDLDFRVSVSGYGEVNQLLTSFNNMSVALQESIGYLNQYAAELQLELAEKLQLMEEQRRMYLNVIRSAAKAIEAKDRYTHGHAERVAEYAMKIASQMELAQEVVENIRVAATLHDIGKIGLHDAILLKPDSLTMEEFNQVKLHPLVGADILAPLQMDEQILDGVKYHHERHDGRGYPAGRRGAEINVAARIIAVADAFDAMTSSRPYREALALATAVEEINKNKGSQFDPEVVAAFDQLVFSDNKEGKTKLMSNEC